MEGIEVRAAGSRLCVEGAGMRFGEFLRAKGVLTEADIEQILQDQMKTNVWVGTLAYLLGFISFEDVGRVLAAQRITGQRFCEAATTLGVLTEEHAERVLALQAAKRVRFGEIAVAIEKLTPAELRQLLDEFEHLEPAPGR